MTQPSKRAKTEGASGALPSSIIVNFANQDGERAGPPVDLPIDSNVKQLDLLINNLLGNEEQLPYTFYVNDVEVGGSIKETLESLQSTSKMSFEDTLHISYQPLSLFRVRPVTRCVETMPGHTDAVLHVSYSPDGRKLASGGGDMAVRFWNVITHMPVHTCTGHRHHVLCTAWAPSGAYFVSADRAGEIRVWNPDTGEQRGPALRGHSKWITSLSFEPFHCDPTCTRLASSSKDNSIKVWDTITGACLTTVCGHTDSVESIRWGGAGLLYSASRDRTIKVWAIDGHGRNQHKLVRTLTGHAHRINSIALNCDHVLRTGAFQLGDRITSKLNKNGKDVDKNQNNLEKSELEESMNSRSDNLADLQQIALERYRAIVGMNMSESSMLEEQAPRESQENADGAASASVRGERLASCSDDFTLFLWAPQESKSPLIRMTGHQQLVNHIAFSPDGRFLASGSFDKKVKLWCGKTGRFLATLNGHVGAVYQLAWSPDSNFLVSASKDSTVKLWGVKNTKKALHTLPGHEDEVYTVDWSPNTSLVASGSKDRTIKIWHH